MVYRQLTDEEIKTLLSRNCVAPDWSTILVRKAFTPENISGVRFYGHIKLGIISADGEPGSGHIPETGIFNSTIADCEIGDHVLISDVKKLSNYIIEDHVRIDDVGTLEVTEATTFGNGVEIDVLNEGGGRGLPLFDRLSSQIAYLAVAYRHDKDFTAAILRLIREYCKSRQSGKGRVEAGARISHTPMIRNVNIGKEAVISGATLLEEGTIVSCGEAPVQVGEGVVARKFIILSGSKIGSGAILDRSFLGQGVTMGKQFSSENSLFFANCEAFHGEACSLFAGPFTVTHHKSTLMIANMCSFFNAGSGTNQSNHMYKLGPVHQGIFERGSKTGSFAYMMLPCMVGAYTVVMGKHTGNFDTSDFPFSYITEEKGRSELTPAMNIFTVGTSRDIQKWPQRDKRKDPEKLDLLHYGMFNPYIIGKMVKGVRTLSELEEKTPLTRDNVNYKGVTIHRILLKATRKYYEMGLKIYMGREIAGRLRGVGKDTPFEEIRTKLHTGGREGAGHWIDVGGMFAPANKIEELTNDIRSGDVLSISDLHKRLRDIYEQYQSLCLGVVCRIYR